MKASQPKSAKRDLLLQTAQRLMLQRGYWATSVEEICAASGLSKGVFFHYFSSKKDLGAHTLEYFFNDIVARLSSNVESLPQDPLERVQAVLYGMAHILNSQDGPGGCLIATFTIDTAESDPELRERCAAYFQGWSRLLQRFLQEAIEHFTPQTLVDSAQLAAYCISVIEGSLLVVRAQQDASLLSGNLDLLMEHISLLLRGPQAARRLPSTRGKRKSAS